MSIDVTAGMNASWSSMRGDARTEAVRYAADSSRAQAGRDVVDRADRSSERPAEPNRPGPPAPPGQGRFVDTRA